MYKALSPISSRRNNTAKVMLVKPIPNSKAFIDTIKSRPSYVEFKARVEDGQPMKRKDVQKCT